MQMWGGGWDELIYIFIFLKKSPGLSAQDYEQSTYLFSYSVHDCSCVPPGIFYWWRLQFTSPQEAFWGPALRVGFFDGPVMGGPAWTAPVKWEMIRGVMFCYVRFKLELSKLLLIMPYMATRWYSTLWEMAGSYVSPSNGWLSTTALVCLAQVVASLLFCSAASLKFNVTHRQVVTRLHCSLLWITVH